MLLTTATHQAVTVLTDEQSLSPPRTPGRKMSDTVSVTFTCSSMCVCVCGSGCLDTLSDMFGGKHREIPKVVLWAIKTPKDRGSQKPLSGNTTQDTSQISKHKVKLFVMGCIS